MPAWLRLVGIIIFSTFLVAAAAKRSNMPNHTAVLAIAQRTERQEHQLANVMIYVIVPHAVAARMWTVPCHGLNVLGACQCTFGGRAPREGAHGRSRR
jgi:hypothetical protein